MTITEYEQTTLVTDGRLPLPSKPLGQRWLIPEPSGFGTTVYTYCEENSGCIVEDLVGSTLIEELRIKMTQEKRKYRNLAGASTHMNLPSRVRWTRPVAIIDALQMADGGTEK